MTTLLNAFPENEEGERTAIVSFGEVIDALTRILRTHTRDVLLHDRGLKTSVRATRRPSKRTSKKYGCQVAKPFGEGTTGVLGFLRAARAFHFASDQAPYDGSPRYTC
jgi:hypothetical protein